MPHKKKKPESGRGTQPVSEQLPAGQRGGAKGPLTKADPTAPPKERVLAPQSVRARGALTSGGGFKASPENVAAAKLKADTEKARADPQVQEIIQILTQDPKKFTVKTAEENFGIKIDPSINFDALNKFQKLEVVDKALFGAGQIVGEGLSVLGTGTTPLAGLTGGRSLLDIIGARLPDSFIIKQVGENRQAVVNTVNSLFEAADEAFEVMDRTMREGDFVDKLRVAQEAIELRDDMDAGLIVLAVLSETEIDQSLTDARAKYTSAVIKRNKVTDRILQLQRSAINPQPQKVQPGEVLQ